MQVLYPHRQRSCQECVPQASVRDGGKNKVGRRGPEDIPDRWESSRHASALN